MADFGYIDQQDAFDHVIQGNAFRVDFLSDYSFGHGRFRIQWACEDTGEDTTSSPTTMARMGGTTLWSTETTSTTMTTTTTVTTTMGGTQVRVRSCETSFCEEMHFELDQKPTNACDIVLVLSRHLCDQTDQDWKNEETKLLYPRYARFDELKMFESQWRAQMDTWYIAGFYSGFANGLGYGSHIIKQSVVERDVPRCDEFGAHLMCRDIDSFDALEITTTQILAVHIDQDPPEEHRACRVKTLADFQESVFLKFEFKTYDQSIRKDNIKQSISDTFHTALTRDIFSYSRRPGVVTMGAYMRRRQWRRWFDNILDRTLSDFVRGRHCLLVNIDPSVFWSTHVLRGDCALEMTSIQSICAHFDAFLAVTYQFCPDDRKRMRLAERCGTIIQHVERIMSDVAMLIAPDMMELNEELGTKSINQLIDESSSKKDRIINPVSKFAPV